MTVKMATSNAAILLEADPGSPRRPVSHALTGHSPRPRAPRFTVIKSAASSWIPNPVRATKARIGPRCDDCARRHVDNSHASFIGAAGGGKVERRENVTAIGVITARSPAVPAPAIGNVPSSDRFTVSTNASDAGMPRRLTTRVRSDGVSISDSGCTPTGIDLVRAFWPILMRFTLPSPRDDTQRNVPERVWITSSALTIGATLKSMVPVGVSMAVSSSPVSCAMKTVCPSREGYGPAISQAGCCCS